MAMQHCSICGKDFPNKYSLQEAKRCEADGCDALLCAMDWGRSNRRCRNHGYQVTKPEKSVGAGEGARRPPPSEDEMEREPGRPAPGPVTKGEKTMDNTPQEPISSASKLARAKAAMQEVIRLTKKMGAGAASLMSKLKTDKSPEAMMRTIDQSVETNQKRSAEVAGKMEALFNEVAGKKAQYEKAPPARKRILEAELKTRLAAYKATEREYHVLLENERVLSEVKGRMMEVMAYGMAGVNEAQIDQLIDEVEEKVDAAEGRVAAARDLDKAGKRRERESDGESFAEQLADFDTDGPSSVTPEPGAPEPSAGEVKTPAAPPKEGVKEE
jgi:hypothetical protein